MLNTFALANPNFWYGNAKYLIETSVLGFIKPIALDGTGFVAQTYL